MKPIKNHLYKGFSLLEMLLVVALVSIMTLYAINYLRSHQQQKNLDNSVSQIEYLLQAAMSYYKDQDQWPASLNDLIPSYITEKDVCSPWPGTGNSQCPAQQLYQMAAFLPGTDKVSSKVFAVTIQLPTTEMAQYLGSLLPSSAVQNNILTGYISSTQNNVANIPGWIHSAGSVGNGDKVDMPICNKGYEGHVIFTPQYMTGDEKVTGWIRNKNKYLNFYFNLDTLKDINTSPNFKTNHGYVYEASDPVKYAYFITFCVANGQWIPQIKFNTNGAPDKNAGQCDTTWQKYNKEGARC